MTLPHLLFHAFDSTNVPDDAALPDVIRLLRKHLGMDVAFVSEFSKNKREFKFVDSTEAECPVQAGVAHALEETYCQRIVNGVFPSLIPDVHQFPKAAELPVTNALRIGAYLGVPIRLSDGSVYGTFCCYSHAPDHSLNERDLAMMRICADLAARQIDREQEAKKQRREIEVRVRAALEAEGISIVYQPIVDLRRRAVVGFEALSRFLHHPEMPPDTFFNEAQAVGLGPALEMKAIQLALQGLSQLDDGIYVSVNASPETIVSPNFLDIFRDVPGARVLLEITEHAVVEHYQGIEHVLRACRERGIQLAVDDAGAGYASFRHILRLAPERIKLDASLTKGIDSDPARRALVAAFVRFSEDTGSKLIAEGVETAHELEALQALGVAKGQGHFLGRPMSLHCAARLLHA